MKQHPDEILKNVSQSVLFRMTGKFDRTAALETLNRAAGIFILALQDMGGEAPDDPNFYQTWGQLSGLPSAESFALLKSVMVDIDWIWRVDRADGFHLLLTGKGREKAAGYAKHLKPSVTDED